jgi:two-component system, OmpR family, sensor histidine kinase KdpD
MSNIRLKWATRKSLPQRVLAAVAAPLAVTLLAIPERHPRTAVVAVLYVFAVVVAARIGGAPSGVAASVISFLLLNFFFTEPLHTFFVAAPEDLISLFVFLAASVIVGVLLSSALDAKAKAERREHEARLLNRLATRLLSGEPIEKVLAGLAQGMCEVFDLSRCEIVTDLTPSTEIARADVPGHPQKVSLEARGEEIGEIRIWAGARGRLSEDERTVIRSLATQMALALEGMRLSIEVRRAELEAHTSRLKADLFSGVTHDVKTPLAAIMAAVTSLIEGRGFSEVERREHLDTIKQEAERLHRVVNNLLDVARLRAGALVAAKVPSAVDELMESVLNRLRPSLEDRPVEIRVGEGIPEVPMDVVQIDQVLNNLIENSIKFSPPGSPISLVAVGHPRGVRVTVSDRGPGIPKEDRVRIFEPFERGGVAQSGTGLGLAISKAIVVAHGGRMWVSDNPQGGAAFTFELPCGTGPSEEEVSDVRASTRR